MIEVIPVEADEDDDYPPEENTRSDSEEKNDWPASDKEDIDHEMLNDGMEFECVRILKINLLICASDVHICCSLFISFRRIISFPLRMTLSLPLPLSPPPQPLLMNLMTALKKVELNQNNAIRIPHTATKNGMHVISAIKNHLFTHQVWQSTKGSFTREFVRLHVNNVTYVASQL